MYEEFPLRRTLRNMVTMRISVHIIDVRLHT